MALENITSTVFNFPPELISQVSLLITVLQALGGAIVLYIIFIIVNAVLNKSRNKKVSISETCSCPDIFGKRNSSDY